MSADNRFRMPPDILMGPVELFVKDLNLMKDFYREVAGLEILGGNTNQFDLGFDGRPILTLSVLSGKEKPPKTEAGLYHLAILFQSRSALAQALRKWLQKYPASYTGSADHSTSEAFYGVDPEGNGFELYFDRERSLWKIDGNKILMTTMYLDAEDYILANKEKSGDRGRRIGHVHLRVGDIDLAKDFYVKTLGFQITNEDIPGSLFVSAGRYHHHISFNVWDSAGAGNRQESLGLASFSIILPSRYVLKDLADYLSGLNIVFEEILDGIVLRDPWGNIIKILTVGS